MHFQFNDINQAYVEMHIASRHFSEWEDTRNGMARVFNEPVCVTHNNPERRVLFDVVRDANPFFHYMEAIWVLSGHQHVDFPAQFAKQLREYSDDGKVFHAAYGYRLRNEFRVDQIEQVIAMLRRDRTTRRAVMAIWHPDADLDVQSKDLPCNTQIYFRYVDGALDMTVCNRSNDMVWGMLGANYVHFGILHEYIANSAGLDVGRLHQFTNNLHIYEPHVGSFDSADDRFYNKPYKRVEFSCDTLSLEEAQRFVTDGVDTDYIYKSEVLTRTAIPMLHAWRLRKENNLTGALHLMDGIYDDDWREACIEWTTRRMK